VPGPGPGQGQGAQGGRGDYSKQIADESQFMMPNRTCASTSRGTEFQSARASDGLDGLLP
jgi:hypothetical protein